jgi:hypothetical protein
MTLIDRLLELSSIWSAAQGHRSTSRLATIVAKDGKMLSRLSVGGTCTVATYERFLQFFRDPTNWPDQAVPSEALALLDDCIFTADGPTAPPAKDAEAFATDQVAA